MNIRCHLAAEPAYGNRFPGFREKRFGVLVETPGRSGQNAEAFSIRAAPGRHGNSSCRLKPDEYDKDSFVGENV